MALRKVVWASFVVAAQLPLLAPKLEADNSTRFESQAKPFLE